MVPREWAGASTKCQEHKRTSNKPLNQLPLVILNKLLIHSFYQIMKMAVPNSTSKRSVNLKLSMNTDNIPLCQVRQLLWVMVYYNLTTTHDIIYKWRCSASTTMKNYRCSTTIKSYRWCTTMKNYRCSTTIKRYRWCTTMKNYRCSTTMKRYRCSTTIKSYRCSTTIKNYRSSTTIKSYRCSTTMKNYRSSTTIKSYRWCTTMKN